MTTEIAYTVYIADFDTQFVQQAQGQLAAREMNVSVFRSGQDLLDALESENLPRVILLSALLPDRNGLELCKKIKEHRPYSRIKIILVSSFPRTSRFISDARTRYLADHYIEQPIDWRNFPDLVIRVAEGESIEAAKAQTRPPSKAEARPEPAAKPPQADKTAPVEKTKKTAAKPAPAPTPEPPRRVPKREAPRREAASARHERGPERADRAGAKGASADQPGPERGAESPRQVLRRASVPRIQRLPSEGQLRDVLLPELLLYLYQNRATGVLKLRSMEEERRITLRNGVPIAIDTNFIADQALGRILVEQERITAQQFDAAKKVADFEGRRLGEVLVEQGAITSHELLATLHFQARQKLMSAFRHNEGTFRFEDGSPTLRDTGQLEESILHILLAGVKNFYTLALLEERIYNNKRRVVERTDVGELRRGTLQLTTREWELLDLIDGARTLGEVISMAELNFVRTFQILYLFFLFGLIRFADEGPAFFQLDEPVLTRAVAEADQMAAQPLDYSAALLDQDGDGEDRLLRMMFRLNSLGANGTVFVKTATGSHSIVLSKGNPVRITSERGDRRELGQILVDKGWMSESDRDDILSESQGSGRPFGEVALSRGLLGPHQLYEGLVSQLQGRLENLSATTEILDVRFDPQGEPQEDAAMGVDVLRMIIAAFRQRLQPDIVETDLAEHRTKPIKMVASAQSRVRKNLSDPREAQLLAWFNGKKTLDQILRQSPLPRPQVQSLVYALYQLGMIDFESEFEVSL